MSTESSSLKNVVVLGLGQAGILTVQALAKSLPATHRLVVVQKDTFSFYPIASLRAQTVPGWEKKVAFPIAQLFPAASRHVLLEGTTVVAFNDASVVVDKENEGFGTEIPFDYAVIAISKPDLLNAKGLVKIKPTLQLETLDNVFAVGDANSVDELKLAYNAGNQAAVAAANILLLVQGKSATKTYTPAGPAGFITLGSKAGSGLLFGWRIPSWFVTLVKSGGLLTDKYKGQFAPIAA